jgi:hypothetical protein
MHDSEAFSRVGYGVTDTWPGLGIHMTWTGHGYGYGHGYGDERLDKGLARNVGCLSDKTERHTQ